LNDPAHASRHSVKPAKLPLPSDFHANVSPVLRTIPLPGGVVPPYFTPLSVR
jgi:hypothetical protein